MLYLYRYLKEKTVILQENENLQDNNLILLKDVRFIS